MQSELDLERPDLNIKILSINMIDKWDEATTPTLMAESGTLPIVQDSADLEIWANWGGQCRDVAILDPQNQLIEFYNLTLNNLSDADNFSELKQKFIDLQVKRTKILEKI